jgi:hypothetical protein
MTTFLLTNIIRQGIMEFSCLIFKAKTESFAFMRGEDNFFHELITMSTTE